MVGWAGLERVDDFGWCSGSGSSVLMLDNGRGLQSSGSSLPEV